MDDPNGWPAVCNEIVENAYPDELRAAVPGPDPDATAAAKWFQRSRRLGDGAAKNAARTYVLIASAMLADGGGKSATGNRDARTTIERPARTSAQPPKEKHARTNATVNGESRQPVTAGAFDMPRPQIAVQINIAPDMTAEQIDQVFASMAKHFYSDAGVD